MVSFRSGYPFDTSALWTLRGNCCGKKKHFCDTINLVLIFMQYVALGISMRLDKKNERLLEHHMMQYACRD